MAQILVDQAENLLHSLGLCHKIVKNLQSCEDTRHQWIGWSWCDIVEILLLIKMYELPPCNDISTMATNPRKLSLGALSSPTWDDLPFIWLWGWQHYVKVMSYLISYRSQTNRRVARLLNIYCIKCTVPIVQCNFYKTFNQFWT